MKKITFLFFLLTISIGYSQTIPVDFESDVTVGVNWKADSGLASVAIVADPDPTPSSRGNVGQINSSDTGEDWQNAQLTLTTNYIDLTDATGSSIITFDYYSTVAGGGLLKLEQSLNGGGSVEKAFTTSGTGWESISVDLSPVNDKYKLLVFFPGIGNGNAKSNEITYIHNISGTVGDVIGTVPVGPVTFTVTVPTGTQGVRMTGPWWGWNSVGGPIATDNGDDTFSLELFSGGADQEAFEYLWVITTADGSATAGTGQENLIDNAAGGMCTDRVNSGNIVTDYANYANRKYTVGPTAQYETYDDCSAATILGINDYKIEGLNAYPNPTNNKWIISTKNENIISIEIFDLLGKNVFSSKPNTREVQIDALNLTSGIYISKIITASGSSTRKLIKN